MGFYDDLGARRLINAATSYTVLGGSRMPPEVLDAMRDAAGGFVDMHDLHERVGAELAELTHNDAAYVTPGCAAGIVLGVLGCRTRGELTRIAVLPDGPSLPDEVIMHTAHRNPYDPAVRLAGARIREIGNIKQTFDWELAAAIGPRTAAVLYVAGTTWSAGVLPLPDVVQIAHARGVPVIVDAAAQVPPVANFWRFTAEEGADLALFSGGKELRGPQASGLMVGRTSLVEAARANGAPHQRLARAMKVGKEEIAGLLAAVRRYLLLDHAAEAREWQATCVAWLAGLADLDGVRCVVEPRNAAGAPAPRLRIDVDAGVLGRDAVAVAAALRGGDPAVVVGGGPGGVLYAEPEALEADEAEVVLWRLRAELGCAATTARPVNRPIGRDRPIGSSL